MVGIRRIGKTNLLLKASENNDYIYFFVAKKVKYCCAEFVEEVK